MKNNLIKIFPNNFAIVKFRCYFRGTHWSSYDVADFRGRHFESRHCCCIARFVYTYIYQKINQRTEFINKIISNTFPELIKNQRAIHKSVKCTQKMCEEKFGYAPPKPSPLAAEGIEIPLKDTPDLQLFHQKLQDEKFFDTSVSIHIINYPCSIIQVI